jgi:hypothetical protein
VTPATPLPTIFQVRRPPSWRGLAGRGFEVRQGLGADGDLPLALVTPGDKCRWAARRQLGAHGRKRLAVGIAPAMNVASGYLAHALTCLFEPRYVSGEGSNRLLSAVEGEVTLRSGFLRAPSWPREERSRGDPGREPLSLSKVLEEGGGSE